MASYRTAIQWIAANDGDGDPDRLDAASIASVTTVLLVADLFGKDEATVAKAVVAARKRNDKGEHR